MFYICDRLYLTIHKNIDETKKIINESKDFITSTDFHDSYIPLNNDYGPINMGNIINFCEFINNKMIDPKISHRNIVYYVYLINKNNSDLLNAVLMMGCFLIIKMNMCVNKVIFDILEIFNEHPCYFIDCVSKWGGYYSSITDCLRAVYFVHKNKIEDFNNFNIKDYEYLTNYSKRDMNIIANKFLAMCEPTTKTINNVFTELKKRNIKLIIRLNNDSDYGTEVDNSIKVVDLFFKDYSVPSLKIVKKFMNIVNSTNYNELVAVHCHAGLGRTGLLICIWLILKLNFTPSDAIAYIRIMRPGSIMGCQGFFLESIEHFRKLI